MHPYLHLLLLQSAAFEIPWSGMALDYAGFLAYFAMFGALGFHFVVIAGLRSDAANGAGPNGEAAAAADVARSADAGAATFGLVGTIIFLIDLLAGVAAAAGEKHIGLFQAIQAGGSRLATPLTLGVVLFAAFAVATRRVRAGWIIALGAGLVLVLRSVVTGKWATLVNPVHEMAASVWLGTLLVLVTVGLPAILRSRLATEHRGALVAELVARFSPLALTAVGLLGVTGVITAWRHLKFVAALWTTSYGYALDAKLVVVAMVMGLGAWNWRRVTPQLGSESAAYGLRRSARAELAVAAVVLAITALLVNLPSPKLPH